MDFTENPADSQCIVTTRNERPLAGYNYPSSCYFFLTGKPSAEEESLTQGAARVKFKAIWKGTFDKILKSEEDKKKFTSLSTKLAGKLNTKKPGIE